MKLEPQKYALAESHTNDELWRLLLTSRMAKSKYAEFSRLFGDPKKDKLVSELMPDLEKVFVVEHKIYGRVERWRFFLTDNVSNFIMSKKYSDWLNFPFEDLSLNSEEVILLATITHENFIFIATDEKERNSLNALGFDFGDLIII